MVIWGPYQDCMRLVLKAWFASTLQAPFPAHILTEQMASKTDPVVGLERPISLRITARLSLPPCLLARH
jgi:hypothetical protein